MAIILAAFGIYVVESHAENSTIRNLGDAFWWAFLPLQLHPMVMYILLL